MTTTDCSQDVLNQQLAEILGSAARLAVLRVFLVDPTRAYYQRQVEAATGLPIRAVQRELDRFTSIGLTYRHAEGNRTYYQADPEHPLFRELRALVLKTAGQLLRVRAALAMMIGLRMAFLSGDGAVVLLVFHAGQSTAVTPLEGIAVRVMESEAFSEALSGRAGWLADFLVSGVDLLGRRDDLLWRRIEAAGFNVPKGEGVA